MDSLIHQGDCLIQFNCTIAEHQNVQRGTRLKITYIICILLDFLFKIFLLLCKQICTLLCFSQLCSKGPQFEVKFIKFLLGSWHTLGFSLFNYSTQLVSQPLKDCLCWKSLVKKKCFLKLSEPLIFTYKIDK